VTTLEQQFRDHVNEGAVVRWIRRTLRRWLHSPPPRFHLAVGVLTPSENLISTRIFVTHEVRGSFDEGYGHMTHIELPYPVVVRDGEQLVVAIEDIHLRRLNEERP